MQLIKNLLRIISILAIAVLLSACEFSTPFRYSESSGGVKAASPDDPVILAITYSVLKDNEYRDTFWEHTFKVQRDIENNPGFVGASLRRSLLGAEGWTMTAWENHQSLNAFVRSDVHIEAMKVGWPAVDEGYFARIEITRGELPLSWDVAHEIAVNEGELYTQEYPSRHVSE